MKRLFLFVICFTLSLSLHAQVVVPPTTAECATSNDGTVVGTPNPLDPPQVAIVYSGSLPAATYYIEIGWYDAASHNTLVSPEVQSQLVSTGELQISPPSSGMPVTAVGANVYIGTTSGGETLQGTTVGSAVFTQSTALVAGAAPPTTNNTVCQIIANDAGWPTGTGYVVGLTTPAGQTLPGYPMQWQILGPGGTLNLSAGLPQYNGTVTYPVPILARPYGHGPQSISGPLSLGGYSLTAGGLTFTGLAQLLNGGLFNGTFLSSTATLSGTWLGNPEFSGNPAFTGNPNFDVFNAGAIKFNNTLGVAGQCATSTGSTDLWTGMCQSGVNTPTIAAGSGAGSGPTVSVDANSMDKAGLITLVTGSGPSTGVLFTLTFGTINFPHDFVSAAYCWLWPTNSAAAASAVQAALTVSTGSPTSFSVSQASGAVAGSTTYQWVYGCNGS